MISEFVREQKKDIFRRLDRINIKEILYRYICIDFFGAVWYNKG